MSEWQAFFGGSYEAQSTIADCEDIWNLYAEQAQSKGATYPRALYPTPGVTVIGSAATGQGRAHFFMNGREWAVIGDTFYEVSSNGSLTNRGTVQLDGNPATICSNGDLGDQLFVTSGGNGYVYNLTANTLTQIAALNGRATMGGHIDGYFLALDTTSSTLLASNLGDGLTWQTGLYFAQRSAMPDRWLSFAVVGRYVWMFGEQTSEIWYDAGNGTFPLGLYPGSVMQYGIKSPWSPAVLGSDVAWLGTTHTGRVMICRGSGMQVQPLSTYPLESQMFGYPNANLAVGDAYSDRGHTFYLIGFDAANVTHAFDTETSLWHKRGTWLPTQDHYSSWRPRFYAFAFGEHRMLDQGSGSVLRMDATVGTEADGTGIRRLRRAPAVANQNDRLFFSSLELILETGLATITDGGLERAPLITLRMSNDGGKTWPIPAASRSAGKLGDFSRRIRWNGLGSARKRVFEVTMSDTVPYRIVGADLQLAQVDTEVASSKRTA